MKGESDKFSHYICVRYQFRVITTIFELQIIYHYFVRNTTLQVWNTKQRPLTQESHALATAVPVLAMKYKVVFYVMVPRSEKAKFRSLSFHKSMENYMLRYFVEKCPRCLENREQNIVGVDMRAYCELTMSFGMGSPFFFDFADSVLTLFDPNNYTLIHPPLPHSVEPPLISETVSGEEIFFNWKMFHFCSFCRNGFFFLLWADSFVCMV